MNTMTLTSPEGQRTVVTHIETERRTGWRFEHCSISGRITATEPDGTAHSVARGDMNTLAGHALLNAMARDLTRTAAPIDMVLHCPACRAQHIDEPEDGWRQNEIDGSPENYTAWTNPPHRSHLCHACGHVWRPADVSTNGVAAVKTKGKADHPIAGEQR